MTTYARVDPFLVYSGRVGDVDDEFQLRRVDDIGQAAFITHSMTGGPDGTGGWRYTGGNQSTECCRMNVEGAFALAFDEVWTTARFRFISAPSAGIHQFMVCVPNGDGANQAGNKPTLKINASREVYLGNSQNTANDVLLFTITLDTVYTFVLHGVGGTTGDLTQEAFVYNSSGGLLDSCTSAWAVGNTGSNQVAKIGNSGGGNTTDLVFEWSDWTIFGDIAGNPGPCRVVCQRPISTISAGNFTVTGSATHHEAIDDAGSAIRDISDLGSTAASTALTSAGGNLAAADIGAEVFLHTGIVTENLRIASYTDPNNAALTANANGTATEAAKIQRRGHDADDSYVVSVSNVTSTLELGLPDVSIPATDEVHAVVVVVNERHVSLTPTGIRTGVKSGGSSSLAAITPSTTVNYGPRRTVHSLDPATTARWTGAAIDAMTLLIDDNDALAREFRVTSAYVLTVAAQVPAAPIFLQPASSGVRSA